MDEMTIADIMELAESEDQEMEHALSYDLGVLIAELDEWDADIAESEKEGL